MKLKSIGILIIIGNGLLLTSCGALNPYKPKYEVTEGYRIYDIKGGRLSDITRKLKSTLQERSDTAVFSNGLPPRKLPKVAERFVLTDITSYASINVKRPECKNSPFTSMTHDDFDGAENTTFFVCLQQYEKGYHMDIYYTFTKVSGGFSAESLGKYIGQSVSGDSSQFIPKTIEALVKSVQETGAKIKIVESYPNSNS